MLRSEEQVALDDLQRRCRETSTLYREDSRMLADGPLAQLFRKLGEPRLRMADRLAEEQRKQGDLPRGIDIDHQTLTELKERLQMRLGPNEQSPAIENRRADEEELERLCRHALTLPLPGSSRSLVRKLLKQTELAQRRLQLR